MLTPEEIQAAIILLMKSQPQLVSAVQEEIREDNWMGRDFDYPCYRVALGNLSPATNGECRLKILDIAFSVYCFAEGTSSKHAAYLAGLVMNNLMGKQIRYSDQSGPRIIPVSRIDIPTNGVVAPVPEGERLWRSEVQFISTIKEVG